MITLAFYKGRAADPGQRLIETGIRLVTRGIYSHVELIGGPADFTAPVECLSSSGRDGGVRAKTMVLKPSHWDLVELRIEHAEPVAFIKDRIGARYDYAGVFLSHFLALGRHDKRRWFCSEIVAASLGLAEPQRISPQMLFEIVTWGHRPKWVQQYGGNG